MTEVVRRHLNAVETVHSAAIPTESMLRELRTSLFGYTNAPTQEVQEEASTSAAHFCRNAVDLNQELPSPSSIAESDMEEDEEDQSATESDIEFLGTRNYTTTVYPPVSQREVEEQQAPEEDEEGYDTVD